MKKLKIGIIIVGLIGFLYFVSYKVYIIYQDNQLKLESLYFQHQILLDSWIRTNQMLINNNTDIVSTINQIGIASKLQKQEFANVYAKSNNLTQDIKQQTKGNLIEIVKLKAYLHNLILEKNKQNKIVNDLKSELVILQQKPSYEYLKSVTVRIFQEVYDGYGKIGTGTIVKITDDYTYILTNKHVASIDCENNIYIKLKNKKIKAEVVKNSQFVDLSLIRVFGKLNNKTIINGVSKAYPSDRVYSVGMYLGNYYIYTEGTFAGYQNTKTLINAPASFGCSGSGVFDKDGKLIAVIFSTNNLKFFDTDSAKAVCVSIEAIKLFLHGIV